MGTDEDRVTREAGATLKGESKPKEVQGDNVGSNSKQMGDAMDKDIKRDLVVQYYMEEIFDRSDDDGSE